MTPEYRHELNKILRSCVDCSAPIGPTRRRLKDAGITFVETDRQGYRVLAISRTSVECWFDSQGNSVGTGRPGSTAQTYLRSSLIETPEVRNPLGHVCAGCSREFSSWQEHDFGGCVRVAREMAR